MENLNQNIAAKALQQVQDALVEARTRVAGWLASYKIGGLRKHIRETINAFMKYMISVTPDCMELSFGLVEDVLKSKELIPMVKQILISLKKVTTELENDKELAKIVSDLDEVFTFKFMSDEPTSKHVVPNLTSEILNGDFETEEDFINAFKSQFTRTNLENDEAKALKKLKEDFTYATFKFHDNDEELKRLYAKFVTDVNTLKVEFDQKRKALNI
jgi:hypothetical protein